LGCELSSEPAAVEPTSGKLCPLFADFFDLLSKPKASPRAVNKALGVEQWFCLLNRPMFSVFDSIYEFVRQQPEDELLQLPRDVRTEVAVAAFLMPLLGADLSRAFLPQLTACDASPVYGFGVAYRPCPPVMAEAVGWLAERRGDYIRFFPDENSQPAKDRIGNPYRIPFRQSQFRIAISKKATWKAHSGILEAHGLLLALKWLLRTPKHFHHRLPILIDAKAVLGAAAKGRTSAPGVRRTIRHIGALTMATNSLLRLVYVPSEDNPADAPSRGLRGPRKRRVKTSIGKTRFDRRINRAIFKRERFLSELADMWSRNS